MATQSSILAWKIPCTEEPGRLQVYGVTKRQDLAPEHTHILSEVTTAVHLRRH